LIDAVSGAHLWADRFDGSLEEVFELQDQVASSVAGVIEPTLRAAEIRRSSARPTRDPTAYDLFLRALALAFFWQRDSNVQALELLEQAIERDPQYGLALVHAAAAYYNLHVSGWTDDLEASRLKGIDLSRRALQVAGNDPDVLCTAGFTLAYFGEEIADCSLIRALLVVGNGAAGSGCGPGKPSPRLSISKRPCASTPENGEQTLLWELAWPIFLLGDLKKPGRHCFNRCKNSRIGSRPTAFSRPVTHTWVASKRRGKP